MKYPLKLALLLLPLLALTSLHAEEKTEAPTLLPGRYVLFVKDTDLLNPLIVNVLKKDDSLLLSVEDPEYTDVPIRIEEGVAIFQLTRRVKAPPLAWPHEYMTTFAGVPSDSVTGGLIGAFSMLPLRQKGEASRQNQPTFVTDNFLLFPIDKDK